MANNGTLVPYDLNYRSFGSSIELEYAGLQQSEWSTVISYFTQRWQGNAFFIGVMVGLTLLISGFLSLVFSGSTIAILYIILGQASLVNADSRANLSPPQIELVQIQEEFCKLTLKKKPEKIADRWSMRCGTVYRSKLWKNAFNCIILAGFAVNLTP